MKSLFIRLQKLLQESVRNQLTAVTILIAIVPVLIISTFIGVLMISRTRAELQENALAQLETVRNLKYQQLTAYYSERSNNLRLNSQTLTTQEALKSFSDGMRETGTNKIRSLYLGKSDFLDAGDNSAYTAAHRQYAPYLTNLRNTFGFYDVLIINRDGLVVYTYDKEEDFGTSLINGPFANTNLAEAFNAALDLSQGEVFESDFELYAPLNNKPTAFLAAPIYQNNRVVGVMALKLSIDGITAIMQERTGMGNTGETYLVGSDKLFRSESFFSADSLLNLTVDTVASNSALAGETGSGIITDYRGVAVLSAWQPVDIGRLHWAFVAEIDQSEALATADQLTNFLVTTVTIASILVIALAFVVALVTSRSFVQPILELRNGATMIASGNLKATINVNRRDELGILAQAFNSMTSQLRTTLEGLNRRATELATVAEVGTATSSILETNRLLQTVVDLTKERFNLYHSHIYLLDEKGENLVLAAGAGEPGRIMAAEKRSIPLNREQSLVARAAREQRGVTVNDVTQSPDFLPNPLLPDTHSELAAPMVVGNTLIGVFDIQSEVAGRFTEADINIQTILAAQLASSIQNARSFERSKSQSEIETLVNTIGQKIQRAATVEDTLQTAIRELGLALGASRVKANLQAAPKAESNIAGRN